MKLLSLEQIIEIHSMLLSETGGSEGVRDFGRLESVVASQTQVVFGEELYETIFAKAGAMVRGVMADHPFVDGNKRTGMLAGLTLLKVNGYKLIIQNGELENFAVKVAVDTIEIPEIAQWLENNSQKEVL